MHVFDFSCGNYKYLRGGFQYSGGVSSLSGYIIKHVRFAAPLPLQAGFERVRQFLIDAGQPLTSLCACELRSPEPFLEQGFVAFNRHYVRTLSEWGIFDGTTNPVARTNVCPVVRPPREPSLYAFSFTLPHTDQEQSFVISGSGEASDGPGSYPERTIRCGETTPDAIREKARFVLSRLKAKMGAFGFGWNDVTSTNVYTVHDFHPFFAEEIVSRGASPAGLTWYYDRPPVTCLEFEMDCRRTLREELV